MSDNKPQGCLTAILRLIGIRLTGPAATDQLPYRQRDDFLSAAEMSFYRVLLTGLNGSFAICPKVNLADIFYVARPNENLSYRNRINQKHVDFLLCDPTTMKSVLGVELDDVSHSRPDRQDRDQFVDQVFEVAGLPLLHVRAASGYNPQQLAQLVREAVTGRAVSERSRIKRQVLRSAQNAELTWCFELRRRVVNWARRFGDAATTRDVVR